MYFTSSIFIGFLALVLVLYYLIPKRFQWQLLLLASLIFYAYGGLSSLIYILFTAVSTYLIGVQIDNLYKRQEQYLAENKETLSKEERKAYRAANKSKRWKWLLLCLIVNFGILGVVKYTDFAIANVNGLLGLFGSGRQLPFMNFIQPLGISYYTFKTMSYIIDVYRGTYPAERNPFKLALFTTFFPQIIQGPISRFGDLQKTLFAEHDFQPGAVLLGLQRVLWGFFKKLVIADRLLTPVKTLVGAPEEYQGIYALLAMLLYAITLYCDFTGGIDITIGVGEMFGVSMAENFDRPFFSKNIFEYWRRWHITMGTWFKDYLFYPLSVCKPMLKLSTFCRKRFGDAVGKRVPVYLCTLIVWFTTGAWHGASWNFIMWGLTNGIVIMISQELTPLYDRFHKRIAFSNTAWYNAFQIVRTFTMMCFIRAFDIYASVPVTFKAWTSVFTNFSLGRFLNQGLANLGLDTADYLIVAAGLIVLFISAYLRSRGDVREQLARRPLFVRCAATGALLIAILVFGVYGIGYDANQFIYNQF